MPHARIAIRPLSVLCVLSAIIVSTTPALASSGWTIMSVPNPGGGDNILEDVTALSSVDAWAVGGFTPKVEHWNGATWTLVPIENPGTFTELSSISALTADDVWAGGSFHGNDGKSHPLTEHWNGSSWAAVPALDVGPNEAFSGIAALANNDVWAVGAHWASPSDSQALIEHWNGTSWATVPSPSPTSGRSQFLHVAMHRSGMTSTVVAVGFYSDPLGAIRPLVERWAGSSWVTDLVSAPGTASYLQGVTVLSTRSAWAVGAYRDAESAVHTLTMHWDGSAWSVVPSPDVSGTTWSILQAISASPWDIWAVGYSRSANVSSTLTEHWTGKSWSIVPSPNATQFSNQLNGVSVVPRTFKVLAVGQALWSSPGHNPVEQLVECYCRH